MRVPEECIPAKIIEYREALRKKPTPAEKRFRQALKLVARMAGFEFEFQIVFHNSDAKKYYIADFVVPFHKLIIEVDGPTHESDIQKLIDEERDSAFIKNGFKTLRIKNNETRSQILTIKKICESLLHTRHTLKAYSILKKINSLERQRKEIERKVKTDLDEAVENAVKHIFEAKPDGQKYTQKKPKQKPSKMVKCPGCSVKLYLSERQCPSCGTIRQVGDVSKCKPIKGALDMGPKRKLRKANVFRGGKVV